MNLACAYVPKACSRYDAANTVKGFVEARNASSLSFPNAGDRRVLPIQSLQLRALSFFVGELPILLASTPVMYMARGAPVPTHKLG